ncbi:restriction endonuclease [Peribacillus faecalis]|uniref:restriction endonuclease n=1 Tax=Peribacillus faecalis TaxID=2772559 RepID=UPI001F38AD1D|nr:restriction endonuclease [Peribacillus faecalis]
MIYIIALLIFANAALLIYMKRKNDEEEAQLLEKIETGTELKKTMAMGLYYRFNFPRTKDSDGNQIFEKSTELFIKQLPLEFEDFVANVLQKKFGGDSLLASRSSQFGIDFEHHTDEGLFLGQAKVLSHDLPFETIAILHSNIVKRNAEGGYLVTTGGFTRAAKEYAEGLNIQLIDGVKLVEYWLESMNHQIYVKEQKIVSGEYV